MASFISVAQEVCARGGTGGEIRGRVLFEMGSGMIFISHIGGKESSNVLEDKTVACLNKAMMARQAVEGNRE